MEIRETSSGWHIGFEDGLVLFLQVDFRLGLSIEDRTGHARVYIGSPCRLESAGRCDLLDAEKPATLAPILPFRSSPVTAIDVDRTGGLKVLFGGGEILEVAADEKYEAWEMGLSAGGLWICSPGGEVTKFCR